MLYDDADVQLLSIIAAKEEGRLGLLRISCWQVSVWLRHKGRNRHIAWCRERLSSRSCCSYGGD